VSPKFNIASSETLPFIIDCSGSDSVSDTWTDCHYSAAEVLIKSDTLNLRKYMSSSSYGPTTARFVRDEVRVITETQIDEREWGARQNA